MLRLVFRIVRVVYKKLATTVVYSFRTVPITFSMDQASRNSESIDLRFPRKGFVVTPKLVVSFLIIFVASVTGAAVIAHYVTKYYLENVTSCVTVTNESIPTTDTKEQKPEAIDVRLPPSVKPIYYKLELIPYVEIAHNFTLKGKVWIDIQVQLVTDVITLHIQNITIKEETVTLVQIDKPEVEAPSSGYINSLKINSHAYDLERDFYKITLSEDLVPGKFYRIYIEYTGVLDNGLDGFYRSSYLDKIKNEIKFIAVTQFEATMARKSFPCFDEPAFKARFEVSIARRTNMSSVSNMNIVKSEPISDMPGWEWDRYAKSVPMSTYLVAFLVSDFVNVSTTVPETDVPFRVWVRNDMVEQTEYAKTVGPKLLRYFEKYFGIEFPLPKIDLVGIPDFSAGAMENWGLITFRESSLLCDKNNTPASLKVSIAITIAHELAHQWFGNLVTPKWWNDLWLNEGFAAYLEFVGADYIHPNCSFVDYFTLTRIQSALKLDALENSHPISVAVNNPTEITQLFDKISYSKGATILRMMAHFLTESSLRKGLRNYLKKYSYASAEQDDLWESLTEQAHQDKTLDEKITVAEVMNTWTLKKGYPVIEIMRNYQEEVAVFKQFKFQIANNHSLKTSLNYGWWVPISYASTSKNTIFLNTKPEFWLSKDQKSLVANIDCNATSWLIVNVQQTGFYRVNYDLRNWEMIRNQLITNPEVIPKLNRVQIIEDVLNLPRAGLLDYKVALNIVKYLKENENEYLPWLTFLSNMDYLRDMLAKSSAWDMFQVFLRDLIDKQYKRVGFTKKPGEEDSIWIGIYRNSIIKWACSMGNEDCIQKATQLFNGWMGNRDPEQNNPIPADIRISVYCEAIKHGHRKEWNFLWERYLKTSNAGERKIIIKSLACSQDPWILNRYLDWAISEGSGMRKHDGAEALRAASIEEVGNYVVFNFIQDRWMDYQKYFQGGAPGMFDLMNHLPKKLNTFDELHKLEKLRHNYKDNLGSTKRMVDQAVEITQTNLYWMEQHFDTLNNWLKEYNLVNLTVN